MKHAFTIIEILVVIVILAIISALLIPAISSAKKRSYVADEFGRAKQLFVALNLYESDSDTKSPDSLVLLSKSYCPQESLSSKHDVRNVLRQQNWPANPWVWISSVDIESEMNRRSDFINSYFYLKPFSGRFSSGHTFEQYRNDPKMGIITGVGLFTCGTSVRHASQQGCDYKNSFPAVDSGQPATNLIGNYVSIRTDGSIISRVRSNDCVGSDMTIFDLFFLISPDCHKTTASG